VPRDRWRPNPYEVFFCQETHDPSERFFCIFSRFFGAGAVGIGWRGRALFPFGGADGTCLHHTRIAALSPLRWRLQRDVSGALYGLEISRYPHTVLFNEAAERGSSASELQVRERGSPRHPDVTIAACTRVGARVQSTRQDQGESAYGLIGVH
jgi:hypothetical protein